MINSSEYSSFDQKSKEIFSLLVTKYNYKLIEEVVESNYIRHTYRNIWKRRKIIIENQLWPGDYGFSFSIYNILSKESNMLYNIGIDNQDHNFDFLLTVRDKIFNSSEFLNVIRGYKWKKHKTLYSIDN